MNKPESSVHSGKLFAYTMSNQELADAITAAHGRAGTANDVQRMHLEHERALLAVQLVRANSIGMIKGEANTERRGDCPKGEV